MKKILAGLSLLLIVGLAVGGTLALFNAKTDQLENTFTVGEGIKLELKEPTWNGETFTDEVAPDIDNELLGKTIATQFAPGENIPKNPMLKNTSKEVTVYAAMTIDYGSGIKSYADLEKFATINFNTTDWEFNDNKTVAYYRNKLAVNGKTNPLFTQVSISELANSNNMVDFNINVKGYAVQAVDQTDARAAINAEFKELINK